MRLRHLLATAMLAIGLTTPAAAYDRLYVFGDSLVDSGNAQAIAPTEAPALLFPSGRFTNGLFGRNFADYVGRALGLGDASPYVTAVTAPGSPTKIVQGPGTNFAVGGATAVYTKGETRPDLVTEIDPKPEAAALYPYSYAAAVNAQKVAPIDADSLVLIAIGGNDIRNYDGSVPVADFVAGVTSAVSDGLQALYTAGARNFVLMGVPDIGLIPEVFGTSRQADATSLSNLLNGGYQTIAGALGTQVGSAGIVRLVDLAGLQKNITDTPASYGLNPALKGKSCIRDGGVLAVMLTNCAGYAYYDVVHPTDAVHRIIAGKIVGELPEPSSWALMIVGFGFTGAAMRRARRNATATA